MERESWHRELGDGGSPAARPARPAGGDAPAGSRGTLSPPSAESRRPASTLLGLAGRRRPEADQERVSLPNPRPYGIRVGAGAGGDRIQSELPKLGLRSCRLAGA